MKISELNQKQKEHLAWRLDHKTGLGYLTVCSIARGDYGDLDIIDIFVNEGKSKRSAKIHQTKIFNFK